MHKNFKKIKQLRKDGKTYQQIGDTINLSKQRVYQIYNDGNRYQSIKKIELKCPVCKIKFSVFPCIYKQGRKYCSYKCFIAENGKYKTDAERKEAIRIKYITYHKRWYVKLKKDPIRYARHLEHQREYQKKYQQKQKEK